MKNGGKPKHCTIPDCFSCPYKDCRYQQMTIEDYIEQNQRDRDHSEHELPEYQQRSFDNSGRKEYFRNYYRKNREHRSRMSKEWRRRTHYKDESDRREYYKKYYQTHRAEMLEKAKMRYREIRETVNGEAS